MAEPTYITDDWAGLPHYICVACGYDTMLDTRILEHVAICPATLAAAGTLMAQEASTPPELPPPTPESEAAPEPVAQEG